MKNKRTFFSTLNALKIFLAIILTGLSTGAWSQVSYSSAGTNYTQNFDNLYSTVPSNNSVQGASVLPMGWAFSESGSNANATFRNDNGSSATGDTYLDGATGSNERAIGSFASGSLTSQFGVSFTNNTGVTLNQFSLSYTGEQWKDGGNSASVLNTLSFAYSIGATSFISGTYTNVAQLDFVALVNNTTGDVTLDGNSAANQRSIAYSVTGISWTPGTSLFIRWSDINDAGNDDNLAVDGIIFSATSSATPSLSAAPGSLAFGTSAVSSNSASQSFSVSGSNLAGSPGNLTATSTSSDFEVSNDNISFGSSVAIAYSSATLNSTPVYVRFTPQSTGLKTGNIIVSGGGVLVPPSVSVSGTGQIAPVKLVITTISPSSPVINQNFSITVQAQDTSNNPQNVFTNTTVALSVFNGTGTLSGTITGTINAGSNSVIITNANYDVAETGVVLTATRTSGDILSAGNSAPFTVLGVATHLVFMNVPSTGVMNSSLSTFTIEAQRADNSVDVNYTGSITISQASGPGTLNGTLTIAAVNGIATYSNISFDQAGTYTLAASSGTLTGATSNTIVITTPPFVSADILPRYIEGINGTNSSRVPYACMVTISNLTPNATYRYFNQVVLSSEASTSNGAGISIYPAASGYVRSTNPGLNAAGSYGTFTADASGVYTGLFVTEPSGNATRFVPGNYLFMRIMLNDGNNGTSVATRVTSMDSAQVINFGTTASTGTALRGNSQATAKNFLFLYDNVAGTGSPIAGTFVESDGTANTTANNYASFYSTSVNGINGAYGTIIPNTNANGIRRIEQRDLLTCNIVGCPAIDADGDWQSGANTVNPSSGNTAIVLTSADAPLNETFTSPVITSITSNSPVCPGGVLTLNVAATGTPSPTFEWSGAGSFDSMTISNPAVTNPATGTYSVTVSNACGSVSSTIAVTVGDNEVPTIIAPAAITVNAGMNCTADSVVLNSPITSDNCAIASVTNDAPASFPLGVTTVTWTVTDGSGNSATATQMVTVVDATAPAIIAPSDITITANSNCSVPAIMLGSPGTSDNCTIASVTNDAPATFPIGTTTVTWTVTDGSGNSTTATQTVTVNPPSGPATPGTISGPATNICGTTAVYSIAAVPGATSYMWTVPPGVTINSGQGTTSIHVSFLLTFASGSISVTANNSCSSSAASTLNIIRIPAMPTPISGPVADICTPAATYSVTPVAGASTYTWTVPANTSITSGQGTNSITVSFGSSFASGAIGVRANSTCQSSPVNYLSITRIPVTPGAISGQTTGICASTGSYSINQVVGASSYTWTVPSGVTITSGQGTPNIQVAYGSGFVSGFITVKANSSCNSSSPRVLAISRALGIPTAINGPSTNICASNGTYTIAAVANATSYQWTVPAGVTITSGQGTTSINVAYGPSFTSGYIIVTPSSSCATGMARALAITQSPATPEPIAGQTSALCGMPGVPYSITAVAGATSYVWTVPAGATIASGQGTNAITVDYNVTFGGGNITVYAENSCSSSMERSLALSSCSVVRTIDPAASATPELLTISDAYPNPATDKFSFDIQSPNDCDVDMEIYDAQGKLISAEKKVLVRGSNTISQDIDFTAKGIILVRIVSSNGDVVTRTVIIQ